jgi:hypothetical protein
MMSSATGAEAAAVAARQKSKHEASHRSTSERPDNVFLKPYSNQRQDAPPQERRGGKKKQKEEITSLWSVVARAV